MFSTRVKVTSYTVIMISTIFAFCVLVLQTIEVWVPQWRPQASQIAPITYRIPLVNVFRTTIVRTEKLTSKIFIGNHERIDEENADIMNAYYGFQKNHWPGWLLGLFISNFCIAMFFSNHLRKKGGKGQLVRIQAIIFGLTILFFVLFKLFLLNTKLPLQYLPIAMIALIATFLLEQKHKFDIAIFLGLSFASFFSYDPSTLAYAAVTAYTASIFYKDQKKPLKMIFAGAISGWFGFLIIIISTLIFEGRILIKEIINPDVSPLLATIISGVLSGILAVIIWPLIVKVAGIMTRTELLELQELSNPLLKQLEEKAPGTFQHSRAMANLAEGVANAIGADGLLVRVGAHYHDIGKIIQPGYFTENQHLLNVKGNPHDQLDPKTSADVIFSHVIEGAKILRENGFKESIVEFTYTHHGSGVLEYFWNKALQDKSHTYSEKDFIYPGMKPISKEDAILMIVDGIEAASRTVEPTKENFEQLIQRIIFTKLKQGELDESGLKIKDVRLIGEYLLKTLLGSSHTRIKYQWQKEGDGLIKITESGSIPKVITDTSKPVHVITEKFENAHSSITPVNELSNQIKEVNQVKEDNKIKKEVKESKEEVKDKERITPIELRNPEQKTNPKNE